MDHCSASDIVSLNAPFPDMILQPGPFYRWMTTFQLNERQLPKNQTFAGRRL